MEGASYEDTDGGMSFIANPRRDHASFTFLSFSPLSSTLG